MTQSHLQGTGSSSSSSHSSNLSLFNRHLASHRNGHGYVKLNSILQVSFTRIFSPFAVSIILSGALLVGKFDYLQKIPDTQLLAPPVSMSESVWLFPI